MQDHKEISAKGGRMTAKKYNEKTVNPDGKKVNKHFSDLGKRGGKAKLKKYGTDYFKKLSQMGVEARKRKAQESKPLIAQVIDKITSN